MSATWKPGSNKPTKTGGAAAKPTPKGAKVAMKGAKMPMKGSSKTTTAGQTGKKGMR